jgi:hypothetical protein
MAGAATARSSLELLNLPYAFGQVRPLDTSEFASLAMERRSRAGRTLPPITVQTLQELHRAGVLVPLFRVDLSPRPGAPRVDVSRSLTARHVLTTHINELFRAANDGRASDPAEVGFEPWPTDRRRWEWPSVETGYLYSRHQLLGLDAARSLVADLKPQYDGRNLAWHFDGDGDLPHPLELPAIDSWRSLAITLSALDTYYWPQITHQFVHDLDVWQQAFQAFDRSDMLAWLGLTLGGC